MFEFAAPFGGVGEVAVVAQGDFAFVAIDHDGLGVEQGFVAGRGIAGMADRNIAWKLGEYRGHENFFHFAHSTVRVKFAAMTGNDAGGFLAPMLQRIKPEIREVGGFGMAEDAEHTTFVVKMIVGVGDFLCH